MLKIFDFMGEVNFVSVLIRLSLAVICGGIIGIEREYKRRPAGLRTHILICLGAAMTTLTSQYLYLNMRMYTDIARLGAQVIAGVGFIGAGCIIVTKRERVKGLTTAAGLWTASIVGLACGAGYIDMALFATLLILFAEIFLSKLERGLAGLTKDINLYVEYSHAADLEKILKLTKENGIKLNDLEINRINRENSDHFYCAILAVQSTRTNLDKLINDRLSSVEGIIRLQEM